MTGRSDDWRWLEVEIWGGQRGWALRPLDILVWQIRAEPTLPQPDVSAPTQITPLEETMVSIPGGTFTMEWVTLPALVRSGG